jgi:ABC-type multidrug transport system fused ATPase/permease subunit
MYDVSSGEILLDGMNIKNLDLAWYRRLFAVVAQEVDIFDASLRDNIIYPNAAATPEQIRTALKASHLEAILNDASRFPRGLETEVGERGIKLSGGERQRVGIARAYIAILSGAKVLILDEATSNLDSSAECAIQQMLDLVRRELRVTIIAIAHRLSTIQRADRIAVVNHGRIAELGDHQKLIAKNGLYAELVELQRLGELRK